MSEQAKQQVFEQLQMALKEFADIPRAELSKLERNVLKRLESIERIMA